MRVPSIGRVVHYVEVHGKHSPATICDVVPDVDSVVHLFVMDAEDDRADFKYNVPFCADGIVIQTWHWPEYVPAN